MTKSKALRIGIWVAELHAPKYTHALIEWACRQTDIEPIVLFGGRPPLRETMSTRPLGTAFRALMYIEARRLRHSVRHRGHLDTLDLRESAARIVTLSDGAGNESMTSLSLDLIVCPESELPPDDVVSSASLGALAFEWVSDRHRTGLPVGFWEVFERHDSTGFAVRHFGTGSREGELMLRGRVPTRHYFLLNQAALYEKAQHYLRDLLTQVASSRQLPAPARAIPDDRCARERPSTPQTLAYLGSTFGSTLRKKLMKLIGREERWQVSFVRSDWRDAPLSKGTPLAAPAGHYLADPFVVSRGDRDYCFVEDFDTGTGRGGISVYELGLDSAMRIGVAIDEPFHMSFPYLFEHDGALFMCPETSANRDVRVYRCVQFPLEWQLETILMSDISAVDTMLFERAGCWWMLTNIDPALTGEICSELYLFSAGSPLATTWAPHARNPVLFDASFARNGGMLIDGEQLFRVSQRQGFDRYGKGTQINQIIKLDDRDYEERCVGQIDPVFQKGLLGTHHLHSRGGITVFDSLVEGTVRTQSTPSK